MRLEESFFRKRFLIEQSYVAERCDTLIRARYLHTIINRDLGRRFEHAIGLSLRLSVAHLAGDRDAGGLGRVALLQGETWRLGFGFGERRGEEDAAAK